MTANLFTLAAARSPGDGRTFIETAGGRVITYGEAFALAARLAHALTARGVRPGDRVAVQVDKSAEAAVLTLGCWRAGAALLPLNTAYTHAELEYFIADAEPRLVVCAPERREAIAALSGRLGVSAVKTLGADGSGSLMTLAARMPPRFDTVERGPDDLAGILYTSGTTGRSKGAMMSHRNLSSNAETLREYWRIGGGDVLLHALPVYHTHGLFVAINTVLMAGASMLFLPRFDVAEVFRLMPRATLMMGVPTFYTRLLRDARLNRASTAHMRLFISGSAPLLADTHREWLERTGHAILERYGMTETNMLTSNPCDGARVPGSVGLPLPGVSLRITDPETAEILPPGHIGMIEVKGPNVFRGYWRMPEKTAAEFRADGFFITGDLGRIGEDGYVTIVGRGKDLVISGGYNVYPKEVEAEIDALGGVEESAVIGVPHPDFGEGVTAVVVLRSGQRGDERAMLSALQLRLANYKLPKRILFVDALPRNSMGKVLKNELRDAYRRLYAE